eukprot:6474025-Amphidinium_carterae.1
MKKDDVQKLNYVKDDDKNKREHDMKVQNKHYENAIKYYISKSLQQDAQDLRQRNEKQYMGRRKTQKDNQRHHQQEYSHHRE